MLSMWELNLNTNTLQLTFNVMIDDTANIDCTAVRIGPTSMDSNTHRLSPPAVVSGMGVEVSCSLGSDLQIAIRTDTSFGTGRGNTFVFFDMGNNIMMMGGMEVDAITTGIDVTDVSNDLTPPELESFVEFDLDQGIINLSFSEAVNVSSLNFTDLTFQNDFVLV